MFSGNMKLLIKVLIVLLALFIISKLKFLILILSWTIIFVCLCILYAKSHPENKKLNVKINELITKFLNSKFFNNLVKLKNQFFDKRK
ncbi:hypothetical protein HDR60_05825 [bacterium]|nr:hypothetical protein [bacterium]